MEKKKAQHTVTKGFEIFSVSLDRANAIDRWKKAIKDDGLDLWPYHVSELNHWNGQKHKEYGVSGIPATFLIGKDGTFSVINSAQIKVIWAKSIVKTLSTSSLFFIYQITLLNNTHVNSQNQIHQNNIEINLKNQSI